MRRADGHDHDAAGGQLIDERLRNLRRRRGDDDAIEGRAIGPSQITVAAAHLDVPIAGLRQRAPGALREIGNDLDAVHLLDDLGEHRGLIPRTRSNLEHAVRRRQMQRLGHVRDDVGLRDRLAPADRQRPILIGERPHFVRHKEVARHAAHRPQHRGVTHVARADLRLDHPLAQRLIVVLPADVCVGACHHDTQRKAGQYERSKTIYNH